MNISQKFEHDLFLVLTDLQTAPKNHNSWRNGLNDVELHDVIEFAVDHSLVTGILSELNGHGEVSISIPNPRLTDGGVQFINEYKEVNN